MRGNGEIGTCRMTQVAEQMGELRAKIETLGSMLGDLESRLQPILADPMKLGPADPKCLPRITPSVKHAVELSELVGMVISCQEKTDSMRGRCEL